MDFVTFEIAKKLNEKGYPQNFSRRKSIKAPSYHYYNFKGEIDGAIDDNRWYVSCPFISQVLKWLREEKNIFVSPNIYKKGYEPYIQSTIFKDGKDYTDMWRLNEFYPFYEEAALASIEYVLDNLI